MNKKVFTLMAGLLLASGFGTAQTTVGNLHVPTFEDGKTYFLTTTDASANASALMVDGEDLVMRAWQANNAS